MSSVFRGKKKINFKHVIASSVDVGANLPWGKTGSCPAYDSLIKCRICWSYLFETPWSVPPQKDNRASFKISDEHLVLFEMEFLPRAEGLCAKSTCVFTIAWRFYRRTILASAFILRCMRLLILAVLLFWRELSIHYRFECWSSALLLCKELLSSTRSRKMFQMHFFALLKAEDKR